MTPGDRHAGRIQSRRETIEPVRPVHVMLDVFFAGPDDLYRTLHVHGDLDRAGYPVVLQAATKPAANQVIVDHNLVERQPRGLCSRRLRPRADLSSDPHLAAVASSMHGAVHWFHRRVSKKWQLIDRLDLVDGPFHGLSNIAHTLRYRP